jgi:hypothetical protein
MLESGNPQNGPHDEERSASQKSKIDILEFNLRQGAPQRRLALDIECTRNSIYQLGESARRNG